MALTVKTFTGAFAGASLHLVECDGYAVVIDPSVSPDDVGYGTTALPASVNAILLTHGHFDHILALSEWRQRTEAPVYIHRSEADFLTNSSKSCFWQFLHEDRRFLPAERMLDGGETLSLPFEVKVIHTPGHTAGSVCYLIGGALFTGDTLFADGGIGRTDLPTGNTAELYRSLSLLGAMPPKTRVYPGHGAYTTLGRELGYHGIS